MDEKLLQILNRVSVDSKAQGVNITSESISPLSSTGFMSRVFTADSDKGKVLINLVLEPVEEQTYQDVANKIPYVAKQFEDIESVPSVYASGKLSSDGYYVVHEFKDGKNLGKRTYSDHKFADDFLVDNPHKYLSELQLVINKTRQPSLSTPTSSKVIH